MPHNQYNFDIVTPRQHTNSYKWDSATNPDVIPLWVADMDFCTAPAVQEAIMKRAQHGIYGYVSVPGEYYNALTQWFAHRHGWTIDAQNVIYTTGVVPAISAIIKAVTLPGEKVLVQTPVYNCFFSSIHNNGCQIAENRLILRNNRYEIDFADFEKQASDPKVRAFLLCNPHNPVGRVWSKDELEMMAHICLKHNVFIIADEIHCELVFSPHRYTPLGTLGTNIEQHAAICTSPSKAFNIAGLQIANIVAVDDNIRQRIDRAININEVCDVNPFGVEALIAAYTYGEDWLEALLEYIYAKYLFATDFISKNIPALHTIELEGTYLLWVDCSAWHMPSEELEKQLLKEAHLWLNAGSMYGSAGEGFMRINLACPRATLTTALQRLASFGLKF